MTTWLCTCTSEPNLIESDSANGNSTRRRGARPATLQATIGVNMPTNEELYDTAERLKGESKLDEAARVLEQLVEQDAGYALAHSALAVLYGRLNRHDDAIRHGLKVCELEPDDPFSFTAMSVTFQRAGKIPEAEDAMARAHMLQGRG
jgi:Flp pilus assembly protein TadD